MPSRSYSVAAFQAVVSAFCFALAAVLSGVGRGIMNGNGGIGLSYSWHSDNSTNWPSRSRNSTIDLGLANATFEDRMASYFTSRMRDERIHLRWEQRQKASGTQLAGCFFAVLAWFLAIPPVASLASILDDGGVRSASSTVTYSFVAASFLSMIEAMTEAGTAQTADWMSRTWPVLYQPTNANEGQLTATQSFEMTYTLMQGRTLWVFALHDLLLAGGLMSASYLIYTSRQMGKTLGHLGIASALVCLVDFGFEVSRFVNWRVSSNAMIVTSLLLGALLLPAWLLCLGLTLRRITIAGGAYAPAMHAARTADSTGDVEVQGPAPQPEPEVDQPQIHHRSGVGQADSHRPAPAGPRAPPSRIKAMHRDMMNIERWMPVINNL